MAEHLLMSSELLLHSLQTPSAALSYLQAALRAEDLTLWCLAVRNVAEAYGMVSTPSTPSDERGV